MNLKKESKFTLVRVDKRDKSRLDEKSRVSNESMPKVINRLLEQDNAIGERSRAYIESIAERTGEGFNDVLNRIIAEHEEQSIIDGLNQCYSDLRADKTAWQAERDARLRIQRATTSRIKRDKST
jgi:hypothetical protein